MPPTGSKRIEVDLHLLANEDIRRLRDALQGFTKGLPGGGGADSVMINQSATTAGITQSLQEKRAGRSAGIGHSSQSGNIGGIRGFLGYTPKAGIGSNLRGMMSFQSPLGEALAFGPQMISTLGGLAGRAGNLATGGGMTQAGIQMGGDASGGIFGAFNPNSAFRMGLANTMLPFAQWLSDPRNQNLMDARQMTQAMGMMGWQPGMNRRFSAAGSSNVMSGIPLDLRTNLMDSTRFGASNLTDIGSQLSQMPVAANAAMIGLQQFGEAAQQVADSLGQQFGTTPGAGVRAARGASMATGLRPDVALSGVNTRTMYMTLARNSANGQKNPYYNTFSGRGVGVGQAAVASYDLVVRASGLGQNLNDARAFLQAHGRAATLNLLYRSYEFMRDIWPANMNPAQFLQIIQRGQSGVTAGFKLTNDVDAAMAQHTVSGQLMSRIESEGIAALGGGPQARREIQQAIARGGSAHTIAHRIENTITRAGRKQNEQRARGQHVTISLAGAAADLFKLNVPNPDSSQNNTVSPLRGGTAVIASGSPRLIR